MPMMPMEPAKEIRAVRPFLVNRFFRESIKEVPKDMVGFLGALPPVDRAARSA